MAEPNTLISILRGEKPFGQEFANSVNLFRDKFIPISQNASQYEISELRVLYQNIVDEIETLVVNQNVTMGDQWDYLNNTLNPSIISKFPNFFENLTLNLYRKSPPKNETVPEPPKKRGGGKSRRNVRRRKGSRKNRSRK